MSNSNRPKNEVTPLCTALFVNVNKPSYKFKTEGEYTVKVALDAKDAAPLRAQFEKLAAEAKAEAVKKDPKNGKLKNFGLHVPGEDEVNEDGSKTGRVVFSFKAKAKVTPKDTSKPPFDVKIGVFDTKKNALLNPPIGKGSKLKIAFQTVPFSNPATTKVGVTLRLVAVQVVELVKYQAGLTADSAGFGEEDGYVAEDEPATDGGESTEGTTAPAGEKNAEF